MTQLDTAIDTDLESKQEAKEGEMSNLKPNPEHWAVPVGAVVTVQVEADEVTVTVDMDTVLEGVRDSEDVPADIAAGVGDLLAAALQQTSWYCDGAYLETQYGPALEVHMIVESDEDAEREI